MSEVLTRAADVCAHHRPNGCTRCKARLISVCSVLNPSDLSELEAMNRPRKFGVRENIATENETAENVFSITEGMVRIYRMLPGGRRHILGFGLPGDFLGLSLLSIFDFSADAVTDVSVCQFPRKVFASFVDRKPYFLKRLHEFSNNELRLAQHQIVMLGRKSADERVSAFIIMLRDRTRGAGYSSATLPLPMNRQDIADYLGLTIETVSRTLTRLAKEKLILIVPGGVRLLRADRLEEFAAA
ncbi:nitrogen fixation protein FixK [Afipia sp. Root123D2]|nr:nitrogen fixation protein FixK [Afipia sp. Root123D2]